MIDKGWAAVTAYRAQYPREDAVRRGWDAFYYDAPSFHHLDGFEEGYLAAEADFAWLLERGLVEPIRRKRLVHSSHEAPSPV